MLPEYTKKILLEADLFAEDGKITEAFKALRQLTLADYCELNLNGAGEFRSLAKMLPTMPSDATQKKWVGDSGRSLMNRSCNLIRLFELISYKTTGSGLANKQILDYGCGWGRLLRLMNYYAPVDSVVGLDAMDSSLNLCAEYGVPNEVKLVEARPSDLPFDDRMFDFAFAFSVFSHTPEEVTGNILRALRSSFNKDGVFVATIRSVEWVSVRDGVWPEELCAEMRSDYRSKEYSFLPINSGDSLETSDYGDTIMTPEYFTQIAEKNGWRTVLVDRDLSEPFQIAVALSPV